MSERRQTEILETTLGNLGSKEITGTSAVTPATDKKFTAIQFIEETVVAAQNDVDITNADLTAFTVIPTGLIVYGLWDSITLTSGSAIGYNG